MPWCHPAIINELIEIIIHCYLLFIYDKKDIIDIKEEKHYKG